MRKIVLPIVLVLSIFLIIFGLAQGESDFIFQKGISVCMECIGLG